MDSFEHCGYKFRAKKVRFGGRGGHPAYLLLIDVNSGMKQVCLSKLADLGRVFPSLNMRAEPVSYRDNIQRIRSREECGGYR